jgi:mannose-6-phosphate isomerase-like protein (cupin superfamily)
VKTEYSKIESYLTKDGSIIRELMHPDLHGNSNQSLAEAIIPVSGMTLLHKHIRSEEIYHITQGHGMVFLRDQRIEVVSGDTVYISPGAAHKVHNMGEEPLKILCCSSPAYSHDDTILL